MNWNLNSVTIFKNLCRFKGVAHKIINWGSLKISVEISKLTKKIIVEKSNEEVGNNCKK